MSMPENVEYTVVLLFPGFGDEREIAEQIVADALDHLNIPNYEPGFRFAPNVTARLEIVAIVDEAEEILDTDRDLAMMILHDLPAERRTALTEACSDKNVMVCHTVDDGRRRRKSRGKKGEMKIVFSKAPDDAPRAHRLAASTLTAPIDDDDNEELDQRIDQVIAVLALGVMEHHWRRHPPVYETLE